MEDKRQIERIKVNVLIGLFFSALACTVVWAQSAAQIGGTVKDQMGAVLPGVEVVVTQTDTGLKRGTVTDETGSYRLTNLPVGPYRLEAALAGFRTYVQTGIVLQVNSNPLINVTLAVGQVSDQIEVQANATMVETRSTGVGQVIDNARVLELPLNGRQATELILLAGVATQTTDSVLNSGNRNYPTVVINVAGGMSNGLTYVLDGGTNNDPNNNLNLPMPFPDALQEFKVETSGMPAQYGHHAAGTVNAVTKSGTNEFHGDLFEFVRNGSLNARNAFAATNDGLKRNQFGGTIGGPVVRNKLFFFGGYQGTLQRSRPTTQRAFIPTPAMLAGDFTTVTSPACNNNRQINLAAPFEGNRISPSLFSTSALNLVKLLPPTSDPSCGLVQFGGRVNVDEHLVPVRVDYQRTEKHSLFGRYMGAYRNASWDYDGKNILTSATSALDQRSHSLVLGDTYLIGAGTVSSFRATLFRTKNPSLYPKIADLHDLGVKDVYVGFPGLMILTIANGFSINGSFNVASGYYNATGFQFAEDLGLVRGAHQIGLGVNYIHVTYNQSSGSTTNGNFMFSGQAQTGMGLADFMLGKPSSWVQRSSAEVNPRQTYEGIYLQDTWRANSRLTVNAGMRWEPYISAYDGRGRTTYFNRAAFDAGVRSRVYTKAPVGLQFPGDPGISSKYSNNHWLHFAPRLGLAWDPKGDGVMTVRAAYGIFNDLPNLYAYRGATAGAPWTPNVSIDNPPGGFENPWQGYPGGNPFPFVITRELQFPFFGAYSVFNPDTKSTYVHQWNLSIQRQIGTDWLVAGNYIGSSTIHLWSQVQLNPSLYIPGSSCVIAGTTYTPCSSTSNTNQRRVLFRQNPTEGQYFGDVLEVEGDGTASYNGMLVSIQRRRSHGMTLQGNYTLSHCIGDALVHPGQFTIQLYPGRRRAERANCSSDRRHVVNLSTVIETPKFSNGMLRALGSGWQVSGILRLQSGVSMTVTSGFDTALTASTGNTRANQVLPDPYAPNKSVNQWLNPVAFARPATGEWGKAANSIQGPGGIRIDIGLTRTFPLWENQSIQFRAEAFNLPNHLNPGLPITALNNQNFGRILSADDPRILQLALKYVF